jgi:6-phosphogluconolactonase
LVFFARSHRGKVALVALLAAAVAAAVAVPAFAAGQGQGQGKGQGGQSKVVGHVYSITNNTSKNSVLVFDRLSNGTLKFHGSYATGGKGGTDPEHGCTAQCPFIDAQGEVILGPGGHYVFAVNPGSNTVSSLAVTASGGLKLVDQKSSGGKHPVSVTAHGSLLYALNTHSLNVSGLRVSSTGKLTPIKGSTQKLSKGAVTTDVPPKQVEFDNSGTVLAVTLLAVPVVDTFKVNAAGVAGPVIANKTAHPLPFAFSVDSHNRLAVAEIVDATIPPSPGAFPAVSVVSTYSLNTSTGKLKHVDTAADHGFAACWTAVTKNGRHLYVVNTGGGAPTGATVSVMNITPSGHVSLAQVSPPGSPGPLPNGQELARIDDALTGDNKYLYVVVPGILAPASKIDEFKVLPNGHIKFIGATATIKAAGLSGIAAS